MQQVQEIVEIIGDKLTSMVNSDGVVGTPLEIGGVTLVPVSHLSVGLGAGGGGGEGETTTGDSGKGKGMASGSAGGGKVRPVAVLAFTAAGVEVMAIPEKDGRINKLLDKLPGLIERFKAKREAEQ
ncbi:MAG: sporulation protein [Deltaproteobacteria bacterium]|nr:sporulation protein [Deltaproteobacteria bacterium]